MTKDPFQPQLFYEMQVYIATLVSLVKVNFSCTHTNFDMDIQYFLLIHSFQTVHSFFFIFIYSSFLLDFYWRCIVVLKTLHMEIIVPIDGCIRALYSLSSAHLTPHLKFCCFKIERDFFFFPFGFILCLLNPLIQ